MCVRLSHWDLNPDFLSVYVCETSFLRLEPQSLPSHPINTYTCEVTIAPRVYDGTNDTL